MINKDEKNLIPLTKLKRGTKARVVEMPEGKQLYFKLSSLGLRPGVSLVKLSAFALRGPVTVKCGSTTIALGHGMAEKVYVEPFGVNKI